MLLESQGRFIVDTGYDDPRGYASGMVAAEIYAARGYPKRTFVYPNFAPGSFLGTWTLTLTPMWSTPMFSDAGSPTTPSSRVRLLVEAFYEQPAGGVQAAYLQEITWSLYRL